MQYCVCCGGGGKASKMANITERFSSLQLPQPGGVSVHLASPSRPLLRFPRSPTGYDSTLMLGIPWPQSHLLLLVWGQQVRGQK